MADFGRRSVGAPVMAPEPGVDEGFDGGEVGDVAEGGPGELGTGAASSSE